MRELSNKNFFPTAGLKPTTSRLLDWRSNRLRHGTTWTVNNTNIPYYVSKTVQSKNRNIINFKFQDNLSRFECHSILLTLSYNKYIIDEVQFGAECMLPGFSFVMRTESTIVNSKKLGNCIIVLQ